MNPLSPNIVGRGGRASRAIALFTAGVVFGAVTMVEFIPAAGVVEFADVGTGLGPAPTDGDATSGSPEAGDSSGSGGTDTSTGTGTSSTAGGTTGGAATTSGSGTTGSGSTGGSGAGTTGQAEGVECAPGRNGGATDQGVTATSIELATTVVESGIGKAFLGEVRIAMDAVKNKVNRGGGICGRVLNIRYVDDEWKPDRGSTFLRSFISDGIFAVPVGPSSEGLNVVIGSGDFDKAQIPVVGTDGLILVQYQRETDGAAQEWVWPIAVATVSSARIMAKDAFDRGATDFSIVFDSNYRFGVEAAEAFNAEVKRLTGSDILGYEPGSTTCNQSFCGVTAGQSSYSPQVQAFREGDFVALFLEPDTALKWMSDSNAPAATDAAVPYGFGAAQPLFTKKFGQECGESCHTMKVWTGFKPFQQQYRSDPAVQQYVDDLLATNPNADENNQFSLGAYVGMQLLVQAIQDVGPDLTRLRLKEVLDTMTFESGLTLTSPLEFSPDNRFVAIAMQAWEMQYTGTFAGWRAGNIVSDPAFGG